MLLWAPRTKPRSLLSVDDAAHAFTWFERLFPLCCGSAGNMRAEPGRSQLEGTCCKFLQLLPFPARDLGLKIIAEAGSYRDYLSGP